MKAIFFALLSIIATCHGASTINRDNKNFELLILHNNDMHARFEQTSKLSSTCSSSDAGSGKCYGGFARVATVVKEARSKADKGEGPPVLYLNAGDTYTGTVWFTVYKWEIAAAFINMLKPDAVSLGNHEFDNGVSGLTPFIENVTCPVLTANINVDNEPELEQEKNLKKSIVLTKNGTRIGIIGYLTPETEFLVSPTKVKYEDEVPAIQREADRLKADGVNILIALGHSGFETDRRIAKEVKGIDLVIGGHTNTFLWNGDVPDAEMAQGPYPTFVKQSDTKSVPVVQAYAYTKYLGKLHLIFNENGELIEHNGEPILLDNSIEQDKSVLDLLEKFRPGIEQLKHEVIGNTKVLLGGPPETCRLRECNIGNLLADAMIHAYLLEYAGPGWTDAPIALIQGGGIRAPIDASSVNGNITRADMMTVMPFDNAIIALNISGKYIREALETSVANYDLVEAPGAFLQYSGLIVTYDLAKKSGERLEKVYARCGLCEVPTYKELSDTDYYKILMPEFLFNGGDGYTMFKEHMEWSSVLTFNDIESVVVYLRDRNPVYPEIGGRIEIYNGAMTIMIKPVMLLISLFLSVNFKY